MRELAQYFEHLHNNPPEPFNANYNPLVKPMAKQVVLEMEQEGYYDTHTREECAMEYKKRLSLKLAQASQENS